MIGNAEKIINLFQEESIYLIFLSSITYSYIIYTTPEQNIPIIGENITLLLLIFSITSATFVYVYISGSPEKVPNILKIAFVVSAVLLLLSHLFSIVMVYNIPWTRDRGSTVLFLLSIFTVLLYTFHEVIKYLTEGYDYRF